MVWYKYLNREHADSMLREGAIRVGTLFDYRREESYGQQIGDKQEGTKSEMSFVQKASSNEEPDDVGRKVVRFGAGTKGAKLENCMLMSTERLSDLYIYSVCDTFSLSIMKRIGRESQREYDACVRIEDSDRFVESISKALQEEAEFLGSAPCIYQERIRFFDKNNPDTTPALIKEPRHRYQREIRAIWKPIVHDAGQVEPRVITIPELKSLCQLVYWEPDIATDRSYIQDKEFCGDCVLLANASFSK